jgi:diacylglycerol O-acyltransferase / wax synthase
MAAAAWERLSAQDTSFLLFEHRATPMHVAAVALLETGLLRRAGGGVDVRRLAMHVESRLPSLPRYRQRLVASPLTGERFWVDDSGFDLSYHLRHVALPHPGSIADLKSLTGHVLSQHLDRNRPLWEMWVIEGLEGDRFALLSKVHHCMVDGVAGANLLTLLFSPDPEEGLGRAPSWTPRPAPGALDLLVGEAAQRLRAGGNLLRWVGAVASAPRAGLAGALGVGTAVAQALDAALRLPGPTDLNRPIGPHRRVEWQSLELDSVKRVKERLGGTVNDVVLATVTGALHRFLGTRASWPVKLDYRVVIPVNMRSGDDDATVANHVSALFVSLPVAERDPRRRYERIRVETDRLKHSRAAQGIDWLTRLADQLAAPWVTRLGVRLATSLRPYNLIVTNVPGPPFPLYVLGARLREIYPHLPLFDHQGLGVAVLSYDGRLGFGLIADREVVPDLAGLAKAIPASFAELSKLANRPPRKTRRGRSAAPPTASKAPARAKRSKPPARRK